MLSRGFTLIEMLIVIGVILVVAGLSIPFLFSYQASSEVVVYSNNIERTLRRAQLQAINGYQAEGWGVYFDNSEKKFTIFKGDDYSGRDKQYDQEITYSESLNIFSTFGNEIYFNLYSGVPSVTGTVTVTSTEALFIHSVVVNQLGIINVNH